MTGADVDTMDLQLLQDDDRDVGTVLVVDDEPANVAVLVNILQSDHRVKVATDGERALRIAREASLDLVLLDMAMPGMDGLEVCRQLRSDPVTSDIPVIFVTTSGDARDEEQGFAVGAVDYITKPVHPAVVRARVGTHLTLHDRARHLRGLVRARTDDLKRSRLEVVERLGRAAEFKDDETGLHVVRMAHYTRLVAQAYGLPPETVDLLHNAAPMHDVGKIGIPDEVLRKQGPLEPDEWVVMQRHTTIGGQILGDSDDVLLATARQMALTHHERWDGSGYPAGLAGEDIPLAGRIGAVADVFDALTSTRPYKQAWSTDRAVELIERESGQHFDPEAVHAFLRVLPEVLEHHQRFGESSEAA